MAEQVQERPKATIVDWIKWKAGGASTLKDAKDSFMKGLIPGPMVSRKVTKTMKIMFRGSLAQFQGFAEQGTPISVKLGDLFPYKKFLPRLKKPREGMSPLEATLCSQLTPDKFDLSRAIVHDITIHGFNNTFPVHLGLHCNAVPEAYMSMGDKEIKNLLRFFTDGGEVWCNKHIPALTKGNWRIPVIRQVANGYNSEHIARTFGGIYNGKQIMNGLHILPVELCKNLGLPPPKKPYLVPDNVDTTQMDDEQIAALSVNTWVVVPNGHAHTWATTLPMSHLRVLGYEIHEIVVPGETQEDEEHIHFYVMDLLTIDKLNYFVGHHTLSKIDRRDIRGVAFTLQPFVESQSRDPDAPFVGPAWTDYKYHALTGEPIDPNEICELSMDLVVTYTGFPTGMEQNEQIACMLAPDFPPMRVDGAIPLMSGADDVQGDQKREKN